MCRSGPRPEGYAKGSEAAAARAEELLTTTIHLALTDDWELRGNGTGDVREIQLRPLRRLVELYERYGARGTVNAEVMQQLTFRRLQDRHPELGRLADEWDEHLREAHRRGHDVQLHLHPQWAGAAYDGGRWHLPGAWSILEHPPEEAYRMLAEGKEYLETLLRPVNPSYRCVSFRAGASAIAPSPFILPALARLGIVFDMSIVGGMRVHTKNLRLDFTGAEETFLPFYPRMDDARRVSGKPEPIVCVPIFSFRTSRRRAAAQIISKVRGKARQKLWRGGGRAGGAASYAAEEWADTRRLSKAALVREKVLEPVLRGRQETADVGALDLAALREMLTAVRRSARASGLREVPVILTNHTKYVKDFGPIEAFLKEVSEAGDVRFVTLTDIARGLRAGTYPVRTAARPGAD